jgi:hypothetical protein
MEKVTITKLYYFSPVAAAHFGYTFAKNKKLEDVFFTAIVNNKKDYPFPDKVLVGKFRDNELTIIEEVKPD